MKLDAVQIIHPCGKRLDFSESLTKYRNSLQNSENFTVGLWLQALDTSKVVELRNFANALVTLSCDDFPAYAFDDLAIVAMEAACAESKQRIEFSSQDIFTVAASMLMVTTIEIMRRRGWLQIEGLLTILQNAPLQIKITALGQEKLPQEKDKTFLSIYKKWNS
jgi:hypothetical protein